MISKNEYFQEEFELNLKDTLEKFEKILFKDGYKQNYIGRDFNTYVNISDDYEGYSQIQTTIIKNENSYPLLMLTQIDSDLLRDEILTSDQWTEEIEESPEEIDEKAQKDISEHLNKPKKIIRHGFNDGMNLKTIETDIVYTDKYSEGGFRFDQPSRAFVINSIHGSNISIHELNQELNTADLIRLYRAFTDKEVTE
jgi:hypothetical protein